MAYRDDVAAHHAWWTGWDERGASFNGCFAGQRFARAGYGDDLVGDGRIDVHRCDWDGRDFC